MDSEKASETTVTAEDTGDDSDLLTVTKSISESEKQAGDHPT